MNTLFKTLQEKKNIPKMIRIQRLDKVFNDGRKNSNWKSLKHFQLEMLNWYVL